MQKYPCFCRFLVAIAFFATVCLSSARQAGGTYALSLNGGAKFAVTSIDFGDTSAMTGGAFQGNHPRYSPVTVTVATACPELYAMLVDCMHDTFLKTVTATYSDATGHPLFEIDLSSALVSSYALPAVDKSSTPLGDVTIKITPDKEEFVNPSNSTSTSTRSKTTFESLRKNSVNALGLTRVWRATGLFAKSSPPSGTFGLTMVGANTAGVQGVDTLTISRPVDVSTGVPTGKVKNSDFVLSVDATKATDFTNALQHHTTFRNAVLVLNRPTANGSVSTLRIAFKDLMVTAINFSGQTGSAPVMKVTLSFRTFLPDL